MILNLRINLRSIINICLVLFWFQLLRKSLKKLAKLWKKSVKGVVDIIYIPTQNGVQNIRSKLTVAYSNIRKAYDYGKMVCTKLC